MFSKFCFCNNCNLNVNLNINMWLFIFLKKVNIDLYIYVYFRYIFNFEFDLILIKNVFIVCEGLCRWVKVMDIYDKVVKVVVFKKAKFVEVEGELFV